MHPSPPGHELPADLPENKGEGQPVCSSGPGWGDARGGVRGPWAKGTWGGIMSAHTECTHVPGPGSEGQRVHKDLVDDGWRGHQVLQLEVEDALQALGAQGPQLRQLAQQARQAAGRLGLACLGRDVLLQAAGDAILKLLYPARLLQPMPVCGGGGQGVGLGALPRTQRPSPLQSRLPPGLWGYCYRPSPTPPCTPQKHGSPTRSPARQQCSSSSSSKGQREAQRGYKTCLRSQRGNKTLSRFY